MVANLWLHPGNGHSANTALTLLGDSLDKWRANGGCYSVCGTMVLVDNLLLDDLGWRGMHYLIALCINQPLQRALVEETGR